MKLFFRTIGEGQPLLILHGLFGSADNWQTLARVYAESFKVYLIDQRNHGHSPHDSHHSYDLMAEDLYEMVAEEGLRDLRLIGHSMGGKTIMRFAQQYGFLVEKMIVADMGVKAYPPHHDDVFAGLFHVDVAHCKSRQEAEERLAQFVSDAGTRQFLLKNLYWIEPGKLAWRFNLDVLYQSRAEMMKALPMERIDNQVLFLKGGKSNYVPDEDFGDIRQIVRYAEFDAIENAGHWLHAEEPQIFLEKTLGFLD